MQAQKRNSVVMHIVAVIALAVSFSFLYFTNHAWGAWGDDSAGYIYLAGRMEQQQPLVYNDELATAGLQFFGDEKLARWLIPTHHEFINPDGTIASKYPIGASMLLRGGGLLMGDSSGFYIVTPFLAVLNLILLYLLVQVLFPKQKFRHAIGIASATSLGLSTLYFDYAVAQPMREIPSITFILFFALFFSLALKHFDSTRRWLPPGLIVLAALAMGMAINIRETTVLILPGAVLFGVVALWQTKKDVTANIKRLLPTVGIFLAALLIGVLPTIWNSYTISINKEAFKARDTSGVALLSNGNHIQSLSIENIFDNDGKFRPGEGALPHYWQVIQNASPLAYFLVFAAVGLWYVWQKDRWGKATAVFLVGWIFGILTIFAMWVNPYSRYIMPLFPPLLLLTAIGGYAFIARVIPAVFSKTKHTKYIQAGLMAVVGITIFTSYSPTIEQLQKEFATYPPYMRFKSMTAGDLQQLRDLGVSLQQQSEKPVLLFSGEWQYGTSETFEAHTGVKAIRYALEQRFTPDPKKVDQFIDEKILTEYDLYVWTDNSSSEEMVEWLAKQKLTLVAQYEFSFEPSAKIYRVEK